MHQSGNPGRVQGIAMDTKMAPAYAHISMGRLEEQLLRSVAMRTFSWLRLIDDTNMKWSHGRKALTTFLDEANNIQPNKKFTAVISNKQHVFWTPNQVLWAIQYLLFCIQNQQTHTSIYYLQVATRNTAAKMVYRLALRLRRICSDSDIF